jgi:hypothetical protein
MKEKRKMNDISANMACMFYEFLIDFVIYLWGKKDHMKVIGYNMQERNIKRNWSTELIEMNTHAK